MFDVERGEQIGGGFFKLVSENLAGLMIDDGGIEARDEFSAGGYERDFFEMFERDGHVLIIAYLGFDIGGEFAKLISNVSIDPDIHRDEVIIKKCV